MRLSREGPPTLRMPDRIHVFGASGGGTTSLAAALAARHGHRHLDTDDFYWLPTDPPYQYPRPREARLVQLRSALAGSASWIVSGSLCRWGDPLIPEFELVVFLVVPTDVRLARLRASSISASRSATRRSSSRSCSTSRRGGVVTVTATSFG